MKSAVENLTPTRVKLTVEVPAADLKPRLDAAYRTIGAQVQVPGFRKGKVPNRIIDQRFGRGAVVQEAINEALPEYYSQAIAEQELKPLGQPEVNLTQLPLEDGQDLTFEAEIDVVPPFELPDFSGISVEVDPVAASDEDVETRMESLRGRFATLKPITRKAKTGDHTTIDLSAKIGDDEIDSVTGVSYEIGAGNMLEGLDKALRGTKAGETVEFTAPLAGGDRAGEQADVTVTVQAVKARELPKLDDEFAQLASPHDTLEELREDLRKQAEQAAKFEQGITARDKVLDAMLDMVEIPVPENLVEAEVHRHLEGESRLEDDTHRAEVTESTTKAMKTQFLLDALVERDGVEVDQGELIEYIMMTAQQYGMNPQEFAQQIDQGGQVPAMVAEVGRRKALASVLEAATVTDTDGNVVDLNEIDPSEEDDDEGELDVDELDESDLQDSDGETAEPQSGEQASDEAKA
ncbi:trigger factor [Ornithinimicrobium pekingense]|uniref:Trigger factor n=1 Tax=Ornithinimicrobium pekingense TaxID=384677 RepID=A0ABQ2F9P1_9MICO|nr:trigger factor [Ornithinimicrobium pekingense]GGK66419.1 trigger factor [Ornithinimicrobium pekingense]